MENRRPRGFGRLVAHLAAALGLAAMGYVVADSASRRPPQSRPAEIEARELATRRAEGWVEPLPEVLPAPTYWPAVLGVGIAFTLGGLATNLLISAVGIVLVMVGVFGWIADLVVENSGAQHA